jgi:hypothetical protein
MNERIRLLAEQATTRIEPTATSGEGWIFDKEKFAQLIVAECLAQVARVDDMLEDEPAQHAAVAWVASSIADHFGVAESQSQFDQAAAEFIATEDKKVASRYGYFPKLHPSEWKD